MGSASLEQLLAFNDEIAALVRAGVPLEQGLSELGREASGKLSELATQLADRMESGESLAEIVDKDGSAFPPVWRSVVMAGIRSGDLAVALESLSRTGRRAMELRRSLALALIYPAMVLALSFLLLLFSLKRLIPIIDATYVDMRVTPNPFFATVVKLGATVHIWGIAIPLAVAFAFAWWWYRSGLRDAIIS